MPRRFLLGALLLWPITLAAQPAAGPYARIALIRPHESQTVDFEAGYIRHLAWHQQAGDPWTWYGWSIWAGDRQRWFVYATFGHAAAEFDRAVAPADDERDNLLNVVPHAEFAGNALYEYLPELSRGTGVPTPAVRVELTTVELAPESPAAFEAALRSAQAGLTEETLWFRMVAGGVQPRYLRLKPKPNLAAVIEAREQQSMPEGAGKLVLRSSVEILTLRPTMSLGLSPTRPQ
ncbi:MAG TPA: hypothetical protein VFU23_14045 [Gemmatimonadales bacterium]|nr:hypothetical protein [Gemmatimonadales bacterium]